MFFALTDQCFKLRIFLKICFYYTILICCISSGYAEKIKGEGLVFGLFDTPPYVVVNGEKATGLFIDIVDILRTRTDLIGDIRIAPLQRLQKEHIRRGLHCSILVKLPSVLKRFPNFNSVDIGIHTGVIAGRGIQLKNYSDLYGLKIAAVRGTRSDERFDRDVSLDKIYTNNYLQSVQLLSKGKVQAIVGAIPSLVYLMRNEFSGENITNDYLLFYSLSLGVTCIESDDPLVARKIKELSNVVNDLAREGRFKALSVKYFLD